MKKLTALVLLSFLAAVSVRADVIWQELFNYADGNITNVSGGNWTVHSSTGNGAYVKGHREEVCTSSAYLGVTSANVRADDVNRLFATTGGSSYTNAHQVIYASFIVNFTNLPTVNGAYFAHFKFGVATSSSFECRLFALIGNPAQPTNNFNALPNTFRLGVSAAAQSGSPNAIFPVDLALNTDYQVVVGWNPTENPDSDGNVPFGDAAYLWINPVSPSSTVAISGDTFTRTAAPGNNIADDFAFRQASGFGGFLTVSNLVIAQRFIEAFTNSLVTNAVAPQIVYQPVAVVSNFVGSSFSLSAVVNGQGLGNMAYKWQVSASPANTSPVNVTSGDVTGISSNVLTFNGADTPDTGYYTLVATTPYGLSVTSSITKVAISAAPVPPAFITQPVSQTVYKGSPVTFSTSVSSPGNVSYQWYSNNIALPVETASTLTLANVTTNITGSTYKVAVTNDVVANGVVSTNAVLTVLNPQQVTIAYLRTLVDPGNGFAPTNNQTIPYQVTGTVTTFTNITTGNTSSYWLQDGTAGINIFVTGGSAFRPAQGAVVTFVGVLSSFTSGLELLADPGGSYPYTSYTDTGNTNALPTPISIPFTVTNVNNLTNVNLNIAGSLVTLSDVYFGANAGAVVTNHIINVTNSSGQRFNIQTFALDQDTLGQTFPAYAYTVTGVLYGINTNFTVAVTRFADIVTTPPPPPPTIIPTIPAGITSITLNNGNVVINGTNAQSTGVYYLLESTNVALPLSLWIPVATNVVTTNGPSGAFMFTGTNVVTPGGKQQFYILSNTNANHP